MIPVTVLLPILGSAVKLLASGRSPDPGEWSSEVTGILAALLAQRDETNATLTRIEAKLDGLALQDFKHSYGMALNLLEEAMPAHRETAERERMLAAARDQLGRALVATEDPLAKAVTGWYLGVAWLLSRSKQDCDRSMRRAADHCFAALVRATNDWSPLRGHPEFKARVEKLETNFDRIGQIFTGRRSERIDSTALDQLRRDLVPRIGEAKSTLIAIQDTRRTLGTPSTQCPPVRLWPLQDQNPRRASGLPEIPLDENLNLLVDLGDEQAVGLGGLEVGVTKVELPFQMPTKARTLVDAEIILGCGPGSEQRLRLFGLSEREVEYPTLKEHLAAQPTWEGMKTLPRPHIRELGSLMWGDFGFMEQAAVPRAGDPPLSGPPLMADGSYHPNPGAVRLRPEQTARGWVRFAIQGKPKAIAVIPEGDAKHVQFIRELGRAPVAARTESGRSRP